MLKFWINSCLDLSKLQRDPTCSCDRKILRRQAVVCSADEFLKPDLHMESIGYTKSKLSMLVRNYLVVESIAAAKKLWAKRLEQRKYGSVGFTCYGHYEKGNVNDRTPRGSVMGPCIQSVILTLDNKGNTSVDIFYRTTEYFKKFPADLVFIRDQLLNNFELPGLKDISFYFANITIHPMYAVTLMPYLSDPVEWIERLKKYDKAFHERVIFRTARYLCKEHLHGILKFSQAMRVRKDALNRLSKEQQRDLEKYLRKNHPGYAHTSRRRR
jgi:hypothetical protein